jgi:hexosaminidase
VNDFTNICEPYKVYKRNGGGKYFMYSPQRCLQMLVQPMPDAYEFNSGQYVFRKQKFRESKIVTDF